MTLLHPHATHSTNHLVEAQEWILGNVLGPSHLALEPPTWVGGDRLVACLNLSDGGSVLWRAVRDDPATWPVVVVDRVPDDHVEYARGWRRS